VGTSIGAILGAFVGGATIFASVRLMLLNPAVIDGNQGVVPSLRHAWALTRGCFWRLLGFIILITLLSGIASMAAQTIFGALAGLAAGPEAARLVGGVASAAVSTVIQVYMLVMLARIYRQASAG
jgi:membrane-anchored glycerophosphoryl diester phosphodiesterase (GDPDase)